MSGKKIFWLGKGVLGDIKNGEEIPEGTLTKDRIRSFEKKGLIGEKIVATIDNDDEKTSQIKNLNDSILELSKKLGTSEKEISDLKAKVTKLESESEDSLKAEIKDLKKANKDLKKAAK